MSLFSRFRRDKAHTAPPAVSDAPVVHYGRFQILRFVEHPDLVGMVIPGSPTIFALIPPADARIMARRLFEEARLAQESVPLDEI